MPLAFQPSSLRLLDMQKASHTPSCPYELRVHQIQGALPAENFFRIQILQKKRAIYFPGFEFREQGALELMYYCNLVGT